MTPLLVIAFCTIALIGSYLPVYEEQKQGFQFEDHPGSEPRE